MSYTNYKWLKLASDYNSPFIRNYMWTVGFTKYPELFNIPRLVVGTWMDGPNMKYIGDEDSWEQCHNGLRKKVLDDYKYFEYIIDWQMKFGKKFNTWTKRNIYKAEVGKMSVEKVIKLYKEFINLYSMQTQF